MSLADAVHRLIEVAAGRDRLSEADADALHESVDEAQAPKSAQKGKPDGETKS